MLNRSRNALAFALGVIVVQAAHAQQRATAIETWITDADFPPEFTAQQKDMALRVHFTVTPDGHATNCKVRYSSSFSKYGSRVCALIEQRARYVPAYTTSGNPVAAEDELTVGWRSGKPQVGKTDFGAAFPDSDPSTWITARDLLPDKLYRAGPGGVYVYLSFVIDAGGHVKECEGTSPDSPDAVGPTCQLVTSRAHFRSPVGLDGNPIQTRGKLSVRWVGGS